ncbi:MAG: GDSL-type esterase/lipase family protein [Polyangiaceae bacterium]|nr:GDSL-type esterase/lipase family protein [Polyangiaceae bacterium]
MTLRFARKASTFLVATALLSGACVVQLVDANEPLTNGGVTGEAADCTQGALISAEPVTSNSATVWKGATLVGRFDMTESDVGPRFDWSGNVMKTNFVGSEVSVGLKIADDQNADVFFQAQVDNLDPFEFKVASTDPPLPYPLATDLSYGPHQVMVMRNTEAQKGVTQFTGFDLGSDGEAAIPTDYQRRIEIIGDSITCGYGDEGANASCPFDVEVRPGVRDPLTENQYFAYGELAARDLNADAVILCYSGKGLMQNLNDKAEDGTTTMPAYYNRTVCTDTDPSNLWDFDAETDDLKPQVVLINLGTNDFSRDNDGDGTPDGIDLGNFEAAYRNFVDYVRKHRPDAHIFLAVSPMLSDQYPLPNARSNLRDILGRIASDRAANGDTKVYRIEFVEMGTRYGLGCDYHPNLIVHRIMADQFAGAVRTKTCW